jgi:hypothetical protein
MHDNSVLFENEAKSTAQIRPQMYLDPDRFNGVESFASLLTSTHFHL